MHCSFRSRFGLSLMMLLGVALLVASPGRLPAADGEFKVVSTDELRAMMNERQPFTLVDTRT